MEVDDYYSTEESGNWSSRLNSTEICRVCANSNGYLIPIYEGEGLDNELAMKIQKHLPIQISEEDTFPKQVCYQCASTLIAWHELVITCVEADRKIRNIENEEDDEDYQVDNKIIEETPAETCIVQIKTAKSLQPSISDEPVSEEQSESEKGKNSPVKRRDALKDCTTVKIVEVKTPTPGPSAQQASSKSPNVQEIMVDKERTSEDVTTSERSLEHQSLSATMKSMGDLEERYSANNIFLKKSNHMDCVTINVKIKEEGNIDDAHQAGKCVTAEDPNCYSIFVEAEDESEYHLCDVKEVENALQISETEKLVLIHKNVISTHSACESDETDSKIVLFEDSCVSSNNTELSDHNYVQINATPDVLTIISNIHNGANASSGQDRDYDKQSNSNGTADIPKHKVEQVEVLKGIFMPNNRFIFCRYCKKGFRSEAVLQTHLRIHTGVTPFYCKYCGKSFRLSLSLKQHLRMCNKLCDEKNEFSHPLTKGHDNHFVCTLCGKKYKLKPSLKEHLRAHLGKARLKLKCEVCGEKFLKKAEVLEHMRSHENRVLYSCEMCDKGFINERDLHDHSISHSDVRPFSCHMCEATYKRKSHLTRHILNHSSNHKRVRAPQIRRKPGEEFKCEECGKVSATKRLLMLHMISHSGERNFVCPLCGKRFAQSGAMSRHIHTVHGGAKDFSCEICQQSFTAKATKENHMRIHTGEKPYQCVTCGKTFRTQQQHRVHEKIHSDARPYPCPFCSKCFRRRPHLVVHIRTHTGEKPYPCPTCGRCFAQKNDMTKHLNIHNR